MGFTDVLRKVFPFISVAASLGGPLGTMAANAVGKALGTTTNPTAEGLPDIIAQAFGDPAQRAALQKAEQDFQAQMAELGFKDTETLEALASQDRASARQREIDVRDYTPEIGFYLLMVIFAFTIHWLLKWPVPLDNKAIIYSAIGSLGTLVVMAATYFYGTTRGSEVKGSTIANLATTSVSAAVKK